MRSHWRPTRRPDTVSSPSPTTTRLGPDNVPDGLIAVPAEENTVSFPFWPLGQHVIYLFADDHVKRGSAVERFEQMRARGGIISVAHPHCPGNLGSGRWGPAISWRPPNLR